MADSFTVTFDTLPENLEQLKAAAQSGLKNPYEVAAFTVAAFCVYPENKDEALAMLDWLRGPRPLSNYDKQFIAERFRGADYLPRSYFEGSSPENDYTPAVPYRVTVSENPYSRTNFSEGYLTVYLKSSGADSPRSVQLRTKPSTGEWFLWEQMLLAGIRAPKSADPWA